VSDSLFPVWAAAVAMVLAAIIPTVEGALWHGSRSSLPPAPQASGSATAAGRQSLRLAGKSGAACTVAAVPPPPPPPPPAPGLASVPSQQHPAPEALAMPVSTNKRAKCAEREKGCKRKRDPEVGDTASAHGEPRGKEKKEHDKYCHFCQVGLPVSTCALPSRLEMPRDAVRIARTASLPRSRRLHLAAGLVERALEAHWTAEPALGCCLLDKGMPWRLSRLKGHSVLPACALPRLARPALRFSPCHQYVLFSAGCGKRQEIAEGAGMRASCRRKASRTDH
jgi:hypothetical protein